MSPIRVVRLLRLAAAARRWRPPAGVVVASIGLDALEFEGVQVWLTACCQPGLLVLRPPLPPGDVAAGLDMLAAGLLERRDASHASRLACSPNMN